MKKLVFLKNLISIVWARIGQDATFFVIFVSALLGIILTVGQISLWCGMPPMGSEGMGNALTKIPQLDNGLGILIFGFVLIVMPITFICFVVKAIKEFVLNFRDVVQEASTKSGAIPDKVDDTRTSEQKMADADMRDFDGNPN